MRAEGCALVTGASRGIGAASARALAASGWCVALNYRSAADGAEAVASDIRAAGGEAVVVQGDISRPGCAEELFATLEERVGPVLVLVNNAGIRADNLAPHISDDDWERVVATNLGGAFRTTRRALGTMIRRRYGRIINIASVVGPSANPGQANYAASKAGLIGFTKTVAVEVARRGITVNAIAPGLIESDLTHGISEDLMREVPIKRAGVPDEVAACVRFLASEEASYITGSVLTVDGGLSA